MGLFKNNPKFGLFNKFDLIIVIFLVILVSELHEVGHIAATIIVNGKILSINWISLTPRVDFSVSSVAEMRTVFFMGGYTAAISTAYIFLGSKKYLERDRRFLLKSFILALMVWQLTLGSLEGYNHELYFQLAENGSLNFGNVLLTIPAVFVFVIYFVKRTLIQKEVSDV